ncbi:MAG: LytR C-terminal domain-containing protein [Gammaproteobacteria bacterium]|nr:LytR C-terminal domain-containing protein [Gammaproteobacteria bacterium]
MANTKNILCFVSAVLLALPAMAQTTSPTGGSGNLTSPNADILNSNEMVSYSFVGLDDFYSSGNWQHEMQILGGVYMGLTHDVEVGFGLSLANNSATIASGTSLRYFDVHGKYRFFGSRVEGKAAALSMYTTTGESPDSTALASGNSSRGFDLVYSQYRPGTDIHYALTMDTRDHKVYSGGAFVYETRPVLAISASRMMYTRTQRVYELGLIAQSATVNGVPDNNLYMTFGVHFNPNEDMRYMAGTMLDVPGGSGTLKASYFLGFQYTSRNLVRKNVTATNAGGQMPLASKSESTEMESDIDAGKLPQTKPIVPVCKAQVEIMNMSGITGLGQRTASELTDKGYCITAIHNEFIAMSYYSQLYYAADSETSAREISHEFSIKGEVSQRSLPENVDIRFIVGRDRQ